MNRRRKSITALSAAVLLLGGCSETISGTASPVPGQGPVLTKAAPYLSERDDTPRGVSLSITQSADIPLNDFHAGALPGEKFGIGGFTWTRYASPLGPTACDLALAAAPAIASKLPGGEPNPKIVPPPGQKKPDEAAKLAIAPGTPVDPANLANPEDKGCEWKDSDGDKGQRPLNVTLFLATAVAGLQGTPEETDLGGRKWTVRSDTATKYCTAATPISATSTVKVSSGHWDDETKACDLLRAALPTVSAALPAGS
ncbi:DUF3558 domain-containing protein [Amycolatopsis sp. WAC 04169]|uniref:DUF3558 domain-containing protein n=1 Tax=Amycolatopsis sp. WAC 04169 TaxID=2203197 RepID=UPI000F7B0B70|nr:DUF3558 domain-containing protein [Amycolatopsis sp. WAC 04169]RSN37062.1 DUF3558 domain-containing protein [Amycolatopsis sp. WAC 04169]